MANEVDLVMELNQDGLYDLVFDSTGDFKRTSGLDSSLLVTFFTNQRVDESEVKPPQFREGWWGDLFADNNFRIGSKIWLLFAQPIQQITLNDAIDHARKGYQWLINQNFADDITVTGTRTVDNISLTVKIRKDTNVTETVFNLWTNSL